MTKRVLVIRLSAMGDVAMTSPILSAACRRYPDVTFDVLSTPFFRPFFENLPNLNFIGTDIRKSRNGVWGIWKLYRQLTTQHRYDVVIDLHDVLRTKLLRFMFLLGFRRTVVIDKGRAEKRALTAVKKKVSRPLRTTIERYADAFARAGMPIKPDVHPLLPRNIPPIDGITDKLGERWVGISPFAQHKGKIYPIDKMEKVAEILCNTPGTQVFVFGGGEHEKQIAEQWAQKYPNCHSAIGKMNLDKEMALMSNLDCMVSMDSSAMHICSLFGVRVVSVWGATHPHAGFMGFRQSLADAVQRTLPCRPCSIYGNKPCLFGDYRCMDIAPQQIANKVLRQ